MVTALGGVDLVVFTGGIGEHSAEVRRRICSPLRFLGIALDEGQNEADAGVISQTHRVVVRVMQTDEDAVIARHTATLLKETTATHVHL
jgi:acetate kinase